MSVGTIIPESIDDNQLLPQASMIAENIVSAKKKVLKNVPTTAQLAEAVTDVQLNGSMKQVSNIVVTLADPQFTFFRSGFLDTDENSQIDPIDLNFPAGSRYWWRLTIVSPDSSTTSIALTFLVRESVYLCHLLGPKKANRATMTRAEFLKSCAEATTEGPIEFYSRELDVKQPIASSNMSQPTYTNALINSQDKRAALGRLVGPKTPRTPRASTAGPHRASKAPGLGANLKLLTVKGVPMTVPQATILNRAFAAVATLNPPAAALEAMVYASMGESGITIAAGGGVWQDLSSPDPSNIEAEAKAFMLGHYGFQAGGAIACANRGDPVWMIANEVEANAVWDASRSDSYAHEFPGGQAQGIAEAAQIVKAAGVSGITTAISAGSPSKIIEAYMYEILPNEQYWVGMLRLAQEVNWELFWDGNRLYYDDEQTLIQQKVAAVIDFNDDIVDTFSGDWDARQICTQMQLVLFDKPWEFRPGEVFQLTGFGPFSSGSSAVPARPGCWLIQDLQRNGEDEFTTYTLVQPDLPLMEPAPQIKTNTGITGSGPAISIPGTIQQQTAKTPEAAYVAAQYLSSLNLIYTESNRTLIRDIGKYRNKPYYDCSSSVSWVLLAAGFPLPGGITWGGWAPVSGDFMPGQAGLLAGPGQFMTIYASPTHVFIRIHPQSASDMQGNTVNPHGAGFGFFPWTDPGASPDGGPNPGNYTLSHYPGT